MSNKDQYSKYFSVMVKARYDWACARCGSKSNIQAHDPTRQHTDWRKGIALCGECHADEHPDVPRGLFLASSHQPYWPNVSAQTMAEAINCSNRTIIRRAKYLNIPMGQILTDTDKQRIFDNALNEADKSRMLDCLTVAEAANRLNVTIGTIYSWRKSRELKIHKVHHSWAVPITEVERLEHEGLRRIRQVKQLPIYRNILNKIIFLFRPGYVTVEEAAKRLNITQAGAYYRIAQNKLPATRVGNQFFIKTTDLR